MVQWLHISASPQVCIIVAILLLVVPIPWLCGWLAAVLIHELSHCIALRLCGKQIDMVTLGVHGAKIQTEAISDWQTILCSLAGPVGGLSLVFATRVFPQAALCSVLLSIYNLLPVFPLDGGRVLRAIAHLILPEHICDLVCFMTEKITLLGIILLGVFATFLWKLGVMPFCLSLLFALRMYKIKIPCKSTLNAVQ